MQNLGSLTVVPVPSALHLVGEPVARALATIGFADEIGVVEIDPDYADTAAMSARYEVPMAAGANCVVIMGRREGAERIAACVVRSDTRADVNNVAKRTLDVRKASFLAHERAVEETRMEYGGITPIGLPEPWRVFVDPRALEIDRAVIGSGIRGSKLLIPGPRLADLPGAEIIEGLAT